MKTRAFSELQSHYLFAEKFGRRPRQRQGEVENLSATRGATSCADSARGMLGALNEQLIRDAMAAERSGCAATRRPSASASSATALRCCRCRGTLRACDKTTARSSISLVRYRTTITRFRPSTAIARCWSRPTSTHRDRSGSEVIAEHKRSYEREAAIYDPLHYLALLEHKSRALDQAARSADGSCPSVRSTASVAGGAIAQARGREYIQVLRLLEPSTRRGDAGVEQALALNAISSMPCAPVLCRIERRPPRLTWPTGRTCRWPGVDHARRRLHEPAVDAHGRASTWSKRYERNYCDIRRFFSSII